MTTGARQSVICGGRAMTASDHMDEASGDLVQSAVEIAVLRLLAMTDAARAAVVRKFNARMEMTRRDGRLIWSKGYSL